MSKRKNGFTLVELLAVIVILAVILVIAVPQIMNVIKEARYGAIKSSVKVVANGVEKEYTNRLMLGKDTSGITCADVSKLGSDYKSCTIALDSNGKATVTIVGQNKFEGITCTGNKNEVTCEENTSVNYPMMVASNTWYKSNIYPGYIETVEFVNSYTPTGNELDSWNVDVDDIGEIKAYIVSENYSYDDLIATSAFSDIGERNIKVIIAGNGSGKILTNTDSSGMFKLRIFNTNEYDNFNNLRSIVGLNNVDTSATENMSSMFYESNITTLDLSSWDTSNVTDMSAMFGRSAATTLDLSSWDTSNVTNMSRMFSGSDATTLDLSSFDTSNVTDMSSMFSGSAVEELDLSSFDTSNVTDMSRMFSGCSAINGYVNSNEDAAKFNNSITNKPNILTFTLKTDSNFSEDSWTTIVSKVKSGNHSYSVGNTKKIDLGSFGVHLIKISNITPCDGTLASETACGFVLEFADIITFHIMNSDITNVGGWRDSEMRTYINNDIYNALPTELKAGIISTTVVSGYGRYDSSNFTTTDNMYLLSTREVYGKDGISSDTANGDNITRQLDWYKLSGVTNSNYSNATKKNGRWDENWWLRSVNKSSMDSFNMVSTYSDGNLSGFQAHESAGVSPAFRLSN